MEMKVQKQNHVPKCQLGLMNVEKELENNRAFSYCLGHWVSKAHVH